MKPMFMQTVGICQQLSHRVRPFLVLNNSPPSLAIHFFSNKQTLQV